MKIFLFYKVSISFVLLVIILIPGYTHSESSFIAGSISKEEISSQIIPSHTIEKTEGKEKPVNDIKKEEDGNSEALVISIKPDIFILFKLGFLYIVFCIIKKESSFS